MNFPVSSSLKGMLLKGSPLFCGTMGVSLGGWYTNENLNSAHNYLSPLGYKYKVAKPNLSSQTVKKPDLQKIVEIFKFGNGKCVTTFFPGVEAITWIQGERDDTLEDFNPNISSEERGKAIGCILMESNKTSEENLHVVKSELTFKSGNKGFILWTGFLGGKEEEESISKSMSHYLIYLENKNQTWSVVTGYSISAGVEFDDENDEQVQDDAIKSPDSFENWFGANNKKLSYAGIWEESSSGGKEIFEDIYGTPRNEFTNSNNIGYFYVVLEKKWKTATTSGGGDVTVARYFSVVFNISKNKKGYWTDMDSFCWNLSIRNLDLKDLCYEKSDN